jgi:type III secretory pathway component EscT
VLALPSVSAAAPGLAGVGLPGLVALLAREAAVGFALGFVAGAFFRAAEAAGRLADVARGANMAEVLSPVSDARSSPLGDIHVMLATVIFLQVGGAAQLAVAIGRSYEAIPPGLASGAAGAVGWGRIAAVVLVASARILDAALALAAPVVVAAVLADVALGVIGRFAPQAPIYFLGLPLKALAGIGLVLISLGSLQGALTSDLVDWVALLGSLTPGGR